MLRAWSLLRQLSGDDAYASYLRHVRRHHPDARPLSGRQFYEQRLERHWRGVNRCC